MFLGRRNRRSSESSSDEIGHHSPGKRRESRDDLIADRKNRFAMGHHAKAFDRVDQHDGVGQMRARLRGRGAAYQRRGIHGAFAACTLASAAWRSCERAPLIVRANSAWRCPSVPSASATRAT